MNRFEQVSEAAMDKFDGADRGLTGEDETD